jgi:hypothetical protein
VTPASAATSVIEVCEKPERPPARCGAFNGRQSFGRGEQTSGLGYGSHM